MTVKGKQDQKTAVTRAGEGDEQVPTYQESVAGSSSVPVATASDAPAQAQQTGDKGAAAGPAGPDPASSTPSQAPGPGNLYPFPSAPIQPGYGQSPYQVDETARIAIDGQGGQLLPLHAAVVRRGPRAGPRFLAAFFWALVFYLILGTVMGTFMEMQDRAKQPKTPPGWKHHHHGAQNRSEGWSS